MTLTYGKSSIYNALQKATSALKKTFTSCRIYSNTTYHLAIRYKSNQ